MEGIAIGCRLSVQGDGECAGYGGIPVTRQAHRQDLPTLWRDRAAPDPRHPGAPCNRATARKPESRGVGTAVVPAISSGTGLVSCAGERGGGVLQAGHGGVIGIHIFPRRSLSRFYLTNFSARMVNI